MIVQLNDVVLIKTETRQKKNKEGALEEFLFAMFDQPNSKANKFIEVQIDKETVTPEKLVNYQKYQVAGDLFSWAFKDVVSSRIRATMISESK